MSSDGELPGDQKDLEWYRGEYEDVFPGMEELDEDGEDASLEQDRGLRLEDELRLDDDLWEDEDDLADGDDLPEEVYPVRYRYLKRLSQLSQEVELPEDGLEGEIEAGVCVLKDCLEELEGCARLGFSLGQGQRPLEVIQDVVVYANRLAALIGRTLGAGSGG